jgi:hypothetical protein
LIGSIPRTSGSGSRHGRALGLRLALGLLALAACDPTKNPAWTLGGEPGMLFTVKQYYELNAMEEGGHCASPLMEGVSRSRVTQNVPDRFDIDLTYYYRDMARDGDCDRLPNAGCRALRDCQGFAERSFVVDKDANGLRVVEMSGPKKGRVRQPGGTKPAAPEPPQ